MTPGEAMADPSWATLRVAVIGLGTSGLAVLRFVLHRGAEVIACDDRDADALAGALAALGPLRDHPRLHWALGGLPDLASGQVDLIVLSPGVPPSRAPILRAKQAGVPIVGEIELATRYVTAPIVAVTGTNGKSTVTSLCGAMAQATGRPTFCGGNLGTPLISAVGTPALSADGLVVLELSSYQLETAQSLCPVAATILNLTPDHLDRYVDFAAYGETKARVFANQPVTDEPSPQGLCVLPAEDAHVLAVMSRHHPRRPALLFSAKPAAHLRAVAAPHRLAGWVQDDHLCIAPVPDMLERYPISELHIVGRHNLGNALAALLLLRASGLATYAQARQALLAFHPLPHRMQLVAEQRGIRYYDDSKGTNVDAVVAGLDGFPHPLALIAGGRDKGGSYQPLVEALQRTATRAVVVLGEAAPLIAQAFSGSGVPILHAQSLPHAVTLATAQCRPGDAVVLSPACSSFDMFRDYAHRAEVFVSAVRGLTPESP